MAKVALIFGISGQDGAFLAKLLLDKGYEVHGTSRDAEIKKFTSLDMLNILEKIKLHSVSLIDFRSTLQIIQKLSPDEIYNLAGQSSVGLSFHQPVETLESIAAATINVLEVLRFLGLKTSFYNACSSEVFGDTNGKAASEETAFRPRSPYGVAKASAFWQVANYRESYGLFACSGILFNHESNIRPARFVTKKICKAAAKIALGSQEKLVLGNLNVKRDWGWAPEYVDAMWRMLQQKEPEDFVIATGYLSGLDEFVKNAFNSLNLDWEDHIIQNKSLLRPSEIKAGFGCPKKALDKLNWKAKTLAPEIASMMTKNEIKILKAQ